MTTLTKFKGHRGVVEFVVVVLVTTLEATVPIFKGHRGAAEVVVVVEVTAPETVQPVLTNR